MKTISTLALFVGLLVAFACGGIGCAREAYAQTTDPSSEGGLRDIEKQEAADLLAACRLGHFEHGPQLSNLFFSFRPEDIGTTEQEVDAYVDLAKMQELAWAMTRIRNGQASPDGPTWVANQLGPLNSRLRPEHIGTTWTELKQLGAKID